MKSIHIFILAFVVCFALACSTPQERAYKAQEKVHNERLKLVDEYKKCVEISGTNNEKTEACERYLKAAEALK